MIPITIEIIKKRPTSFIAKKIKYSVISFLFFLPWIFYFYRHQHFSQSFWISELFMKDISYIFSYIYSGISIEYSIISKYKNLSMMIISDFWFFILITISIGVLMYHQKVRSKYAILYFTVLAVVPTYILFFFSLYVKPLFLPRYLIVSSMGISFICIIIFFILIEKYKNYILGSIFLFYFLFVTFYLNIFQIESRKIDNIFAEKVKSIKKDLSSDDKIYVKSELDYMVAQYYFDEKRVFIYDINYDEIPWYVGKVLIPENAIAKEIPYFPEKAILIEQWKNPIVFSKIRN